MTASNVDPLQAVDKAIEELTRLRTVLSKIRTPQARNPDHRLAVRATALGWIRTHRRAFESAVSSGSLGEVDKIYREMFECSERATTVDRYKGMCARLKKKLVELRSEAVDMPANSPDDPSATAPPDFGALVTDTAMQVILTRRWTETAICLRAGAHLAATVMMGALLEALFLTRANHLADKAPLFTAKGTPKDPKTGKPLPLGEWTLKSYIEVANELKWIRQSARDISVVLRDWRNYIHPAKQLAHAVTIEVDDTAMFWTVFTSLAQQILR